MAQIALLFLYQSPYTCFPKTLALEAPVEHFGYFSPIANV